MVRLKVFQDNGKLVQRAIFRIPEIGLSALLTVVLAFIALVLAWQKEPLQAMYQTLLVDSMFFPLFSFLTYSFSDCLILNDGAEVFRAVPGYTRKLIVACAVYLAVLLTALDMIQLIGLSVQNAVWEHRFWRSVEELFFPLLLYSFLPGAAGIALGLSVSTDKKVQAYSTILVFSLLFSPLMPKMLANTPVGILTRLDQWTALTVPTGWELDHLYGIPVEGVRFLLVLFWIFVFLFVFFLEQKKEKRNTLLICFCAGAVLLCGTGYYLRDAVYRLDTVSFHGSVNADYLYYEQRHDEEKAADFSVSEYKLKLQLRDRIKGEAVLTLSDDSLGRDQYCFTLQHGLLCESVSDETGRKLRFLQEGDYLDVYRDSAETFTSLLFQYQGNMTYYADRQGVLLLGGTGFYPLPGHLSLWDAGRQKLRMVSGKNTASFFLTVDSPLKLTSNLNEIEDNIFSGEADTVVLYGGRMQMVQAGESTVIEPYSGREVWIWSETEMREAAESVFSLLKQKQEADSCLRSLQKIFVLPEFPFSDVAARAFQNHMLVRLDTIEFLSPEQLAIYLAESKIVSTSETVFLEELFHRSLLMEPEEGKAPLQTELMPLLEYEKNGKAERSDLLRLQEAREAFRSLFNYLYHKQGKDVFLPVVYAWLTDAERSEHPVSFLLGLMGKEYNADH